jgi:ubiquinone/menaquinone biosynthesis C-methylase UbiE
VTSDQSGGVTSRPTGFDPNAPALGYAATWLQEDTLDTLNERIHDGVPIADLLGRARRYRDWLFQAFPEAAPRPGDAVMELGSGVGWIMEAMLEQFSPQEVVGLDISANMIKRARERFSHPRARFTLYDGLQVPFSDDSFALVYSVAAMQHIEKHVAFLLFEELHRVLSIGGHGVIHLLAVDHIPGALPSYHEECSNHIRNAPAHWHHYYSFDELFVLFSRVIGVTDLDIVPDETGHSFLVHFSKGTGSAFRRRELPNLTFTGRTAALSRPDTQEVEQSSTMRVSRATVRTLRPALLRLRERARGLARRTHLP